MFGINGGELLVLLVVAALVIGPERLPGYAEQLGQWVRRGRAFVRDAKARVDEELAEEVGDVDWAALDPRKYDPRRIVRDALLEDDPPRPVRPPASRPVTGTGAARAATGGAAAAAVPPTPAPYDDEAT
ncbi:twin-arginine translocase TatA/TatE family subunit [uncultured Cellulomonas sp.]|uniref:twin-arginine translocase TatA/TatE family subunit n=1 Tax=uncultured Cellulomonas sp. TaxID=189682 RepID=UPI0028EDD120|nr:twin-arginine translocase TatA/TatE family subunit [uncultured Cellulomonas sp.]